MSYPPQGQYRGIGAKVYNSQEVGIDHNTLTALTHDTEIYDTNNFHSLVENTSRLTCRKSGIYLLNTGFLWNTNTDGLRAVYLMINGDTYRAYEAKSPADFGHTPMNLSTIVKMNAGDYAEAYVYHTRGIALSVRSDANHRPYFEIQKIG